MENTRLGDDAGESFKSLVTVSNREDKKEELIRRKLRME